MTYARGIALAGEELPIGIYENNPGDPQDAILITNIGLYIFKADVWQSLFQYHQIERIVSPTSKSEVMGLNVQLRTGARVWLPILGANSNRTFDAFAFWHFLNRVTEDQAQMRVIGSDTTDREK